MVTIGAKCSDDRQQRSRTKRPSCFVYILIGIIRVVEVHTCRGVQQARQGLGKKLRGQEKEIGGKKKNSKMPTAAKASRGRNQQTNGATDGQM